MNLPKKVKLVEVGPRDGLQNEPTILPTASKLKLIQLLVAAGLQHIEATSFVSPKWVPQMADHVELYQSLLHEPHINYPVLVPNIQGLERALACSVKEIAVFTAASESFTQKNINCTIKESLARFAPVIEMAQKNNVLVRGYISCVIACPDLGNISPRVVSYIAKALVDMGCYEVSLGDTIGVGTPKQVRTMIDTVANDVNLEKLAGHFHDTYGQALVNIYAAMQSGLTTFDSSVAGLGGCPYARSASGNVATEEVVYLMQNLGIETGVDFDKLILAGKYIMQQLNKASPSKLLQAMILK